LKYTVLGGAGFIGSHLVRLLLTEGHRVTVIDKETYAACEFSRLKGLDCPVIRDDISKLSSYGFEIIAGSDVVVNMAAETHVDRSIDNADAFLQTNVLGVHSVLEVLRSLAPHKRPKFIQCSTDEVCGEAIPGQYTPCNAPLAPRNPYAASKAAAECLCNSYYETYGIPSIITRGCNVLGSWQHPEKLVPKVITYALSGKPIPIYGNGSQMRQWMFVEDHCQEIYRLSMTIVGTIHNAVNLAYRNQTPISNLSTVKAILASLPEVSPEITYVQDRLGHDRIYCLKGTVEGGTTDKELKDIVNWYKGNRDWWEPLLT